MPPVKVYAVDFKNGNLTPHLDSENWGNMKQGVGIPGHSGNVIGSHADSKGLRLTVYRAPTSPSAVSAITTVCVVPGAGVLPLASRLRLSAEFDLPYAQLAQVPQPSTMGPHPPPTGTDWPSPWAVGLLVKFGNENDTPTDARIPVTCQFNRTVNAVRLNSPKPGSLQKDQAGNLVSPIDYADYWTPPGNPPRFVLEFAFCGHDALTIGHCVGSGALSIGDKSDQRVFSSTALSTAGHTSIGALGISLVTQSGIGQIMVRLRTFSVSLWK